MLIRNVLIALDFSEISEAALAYARQLARQFNARLHLLHVMENEFLRPMAIDPHELEAAVWRRLTDHLTEDDRGALHALPVIRKSNRPADEIVQYAKSQDVDLIVLGTHGRSGMAHLLLGSVAEQVVRSAPCPVLTVRHARHDPRENRAAGSPVAAASRSARPA